MDSFWHNPPLRNKSANIGEAGVMSSSSSESLIFGAIWVMFPSWSIINISSGAYCVERMTGGRPGADNAVSTPFRSDGLLKLNQPFWL